MAAEKNNKLRVIQALQLASLLVLIFSFWLAISSYSSLPQTYASHFDISGAPNGWTTKSWFNVLLLPFIQLGLFLLLVGLTYWIIFSPSSLDFINVPINKECPSKEQKKKVRWLSALSLSLINLWVLFLFAFINFIVLHSAIIGKSPSITWILILVIMTLLCITTSVIWLTLAIKRVERE